MNLINFEKKINKIKFPYKKNFFIVLILFLIFSFQIDLQKVSALINDFSFRYPPINAGSVLQRKIGALIVNGFRSTSYSRFDSIIQIPSGAGEGKVLTSDAEGNATWEVFNGGGGEVEWGQIGGNLQNQSDDLYPALTNLSNAIALKAPILSPVLTGDPRATTQFPDNNDTYIATTAFVDSLISPIQGSTNGWTRTTGLVSLNTLTDNVQIGQNSILYRGGSADANRFIHTSGTNNLFAGLESGRLNVSGQGNAGAGRSSLFNIDSGSYNTALGAESLYNNNSGSYNTAAGHRALYGNTSGSYNTGAGRQALNNNQTGENNTAFGYQALFSVSNSSNNTHFGNFNTGPGITTGSNNTFVGFRARPEFSNLNNATAIGYDALVSADNTMVFGNSSVIGWGFAAQPQANEAMRIGSLNNNNGNGATLTTGGVWTNASDLNKKTNIQNLNYGLKEVLQLRPVSFNWKDSNQHDIGFIAQEVKQIIPELVYGQEGDLSLAYSQLPVVLVNAVKENQEIIEDYKEKIKVYTEKIIELEKIKGIQNAN